VQDQNFSFDSPAVVVVLGKSPMNEFLIESSFKSYNMAPKFDPMIPHYAILIPRYAA
jgi:hypothetical protein